MKAAVIVFPGSNCDRDVFTVLESAWGLTGLSKGADAEHEVLKVWHGDSELPECDIVVLPGGFSYGDYLRSGAMSARSPIMAQVIEHANKGGKVLGICNGFQVLTESGLLPGTLMRNRDLKFICKDTHLRVENTESPFTRDYNAKQVVNIPVAHHDGNYFADDATLKALEDNGQVAFRYVTEHGEATKDANPNGSLNNIAGIFNEARNVLGMMPHPERHADVQLGCEDGRAMFEGLLAA
ncbi:MAG: phosphoribosylformylglycinamidine synthase subunit PurQ [Rickettsiales bacterium]|nr:phosphoribosylformylglycinamidine synthase subunit PurQ [Rickettsiales bacterium]